MWVLQLTTAAIILATMQLFPSCWVERHDVRKAEQYETIAQAIAVEARDSDEAAAMVAIGYSESRFAISVHTGARRGPASGLWQLEGRGRFVGLGLDDTMRSARAALWMWRHSWQCGPAFEQRITAYAGLPCSTRWGGLRIRAERYAIARQSIWRQEHS